MLMCVGGRQSSVLLVPTWSGSLRLCGGNTSAGGFLRHVQGRRLPLYKLLSQNSSSRIHAAHDVSPSPEHDSQSDEYLSMPRGDDIDKALLQLQKYMQNPLSAVMDFKDFVAASIFLMRHVHTPKVGQSMQRSCIVLLVVAVFVSLIWGLDMLLKHATCV